ncbi:serine:threonine protein phosphatase PP1 isozyme [Trichuris trichiura]|uniref:protein-serine/threonine phosphatase n=1 Tax=Trichuris trichiura TaxID=36087 RepID=A0A077ZHX6_TRITR|nr:serine:threonine protein phosphatase PP1 isozyme [Trichuris trichiura]
MTALLGEIGERDSIIFSPSCRPLEQKCLDKDATEALLARVLIKETAKKITVGEMRLILRSSLKFFNTEPTLLDISYPVNICGDIHGNFEALLFIFSMGGWPPTQRYLFLGDYVDRGKDGVEVFTLLLLLKLRYPSHVYLTRGNHETAYMNKTYGFMKECIDRFSREIWHEFQHVFDVLPIAAIVNHTLFCVHGGISPQLTDLSIIENTPKPVKIPRSGVLNDLLWSDPIETVSEWIPSDRGGTCSYGPAAAELFCLRNRISMIVRSHQVVKEGYEFNSNGRVLTLFGIPRYCGKECNCSAVVMFDDQGIKVVDQKDAPQEDFSLLTMTVENKVKTKPGLYSDLTIFPNERKGFRTP